MANLREPARPKSSEGSSRVILIVDDYQDAREMYAEYFALSGFRVVEASNGSEAVEKASELVPDIILMDLSMPGLDGWAVLDRNILAQAAATQAITRVGVERSIPTHIRLVASANRRGGIAGGRPGCCGTRPLDRGRGPAGGHPDRHLP